LKENKINQFQLFMENLVMHDFKDKVAVITGSGSGIGEGFAKRCVAEQIKVVLADIDQQNLDRVAAELSLHTDADRLLPLKIDVSKKQDIILLAKKAKEKFGQIDLLFNQAGIPGPIGPIWSVSYDDIDKVVQVNLLSMMYSLRTFVPIMIEQDTPGYIINTSSGVGLQLGYDMACYITTKRAVVTLSETLSLDLHAAKSKIQVSVLCPGMVATNFANMIPNATSSDSASVKKLKQFFEANLQSKGITVESVVDQTFDAIKNQKFYILTHFDEHHNNIKKITDNMLAGNNPIDLFRK
jgi:short-subunit dehydrogenase